MYGNPQTAPSAVRPENVLGRVRTEADISIKTATELTESLRTLRDRLVGSHPEKAQGQVNALAPVGSIMQEMADRFQTLQGWLNTARSLAQEILEATEGA